MTTKEQEVCNQIIVISSARHAPRIPMLSLEKLTSYLAKQAEEIEELRIHVERVNKDHSELLGALKNGISGITTGLK